MRIAIYWEQESWGGVDTHLLTLLQTWPVATDEFVLFYNQGNQGFERIRPRLSEMNYLRCEEVVSSSYNELLRRVKRKPWLRWARPALYLLQPLIFILNTWQLRRLFEREPRFDLLLSNNGGYPAAWGCLSALVAANSAGISVRVLLVHHAATRPALFMGWFERLVDRLINRTASALACVSRATRQTLLDHRCLNDETLRLRVIPSVVAPEPRDGKQAGQVFNLRESLRASGPLLVGMAGRVEAYKGHEDMIFAIARLSNTERRRLKLVVIGAGTDNELSRLRRLAENLGVCDQVHFLGYVSGTPISLIAQMDLLVVATRSFEGFGLTLVEAMHAGTPVLATRVGAVPEFIDQKNGVLVNPGSPRELALALRDFLQNRPAWQERAKHAQIRIQGEGSRMAEEFHRLFVECAAEHTTLR
jgi:glycosyltransferase involved in cell wall biosynthesis